MKQKTPMPKSSGSDAKAGAKPNLHGMGKTAKPKSFSPPKKNKG